MNTYQSTSNPIPFFNQLKIKRIPLIINKYTHSHMITLLFTNEYTAINKWIPRYSQMNKWIPLIINKYIHPHMLFIDDYNVIHK